MYIKSSTFNALETICENVYILLSKSFAHFANKYRTMMTMMIMMIMMMTMIPVSMPQLGQNRANTSCIGPVVMAHYGMFTEMMTTMMIIFTKYT